MSFPDRLTLLLIRRSQKAVAILLMCLGGLVSIGWVADPRLRIPLWGLRTMILPTAVAFLLAGLSLYLWCLPVTNRRVQSARICGAAVAVLGILSMIHYIAYWWCGLNIGTLFSGSPLGSVLTPGRQMALTTAICFSLAGAALCLIESRHYRGHRLEEWLALASSFLPLTVLIGHIYGVKGFIKPVGALISPSAMALNTTLGFLLLVFGILTARPERGWTAYLVRESSEGVIGRRLLPAVIVILLGSGAMAEAGRKSGFYGYGVAAALFTTLSIGMFVLAIFHCIRALAELEASRRRTEAKLRKSEEHLRMALEAARIGTWEWDPQSDKIWWSEGTYDVFRIPRDSFDGRFESFLKLAHPDDREMLQTRIRRSLERAEDSCQVEYRIFWPDGTVRNLAARGTTIFGKDGAAVRMAGTVVDATERRLLERKLIEASNREQRRLGQDLHDDVGQWLTAIHLEARALSLFLKPICEPGAARAEKIVSWMGEALERTRMLARGMTPAVIEIGGLPAALQDLAVSTERMFHARCKYICSDELTVRNSEAALQLYRIAQEAVSNALRHGNATEIEVCLDRQKDGRSCLLISDNGKGIENPIPTNSGLGLRIMQYRAALIGADVEIHPGQKQGTEVICSFSADL